MGYYLWHPSYVSSEPLTLEAFVTFGDAMFLSHGTDVFVRSALKAAGVTAEAASWEFEAMRTHYFSSYRDIYKDWESSWDLVWRLRVKLPRDPAPIPLEVPREGYCEFYEADASFRSDNPPDLWPGWPCLVLADSADEGVIRKVESLVRKRFSQATFTRGQAFGRFYQLRCDLGMFPRSFYEQGASEAEALLQEITQAGAFVRFSDLEHRDP